MARRRRPLAGGALADDPHRRRPSRSAATPRPLSLPRRPAPPPTCGRSPSSARGRGPPAGYGARPATRCSPTSYTPPPTAGPTDSSGRWTTSAPSSGRCSPSASSPPSASGGLSACPSSPAYSPPSQSSTPSATPPTHPRDGCRIRIRVRPVLRGDLGRLIAGVAAFEVGNIAATLLILRATELLEPGPRTRPRDHLRARALHRVQPRRHRQHRSPAGRLADRIGAATGRAGRRRRRIRRRLPRLPPRHHAVLALLPFIAAGLGIGCVETAEHAAVAALAPDELRGSAFGLLATIQAMGNLAASGVAGVLWTAVSPRRRSPTSPDGPRGRNSGRWPRHRSLSHRSRACEPIRPWPH